VEEEQSWTPFGNSSGHPEQNICIKKIENEIQAKTTPKSTEISLSGELPGFLALILLYSKTTILHYCRHFKSRWRFAEEKKLIFENGRRKGFYFTV
jgi:hypothetical protein